MDYPDPENEEQNNQPEDCDITAKQARNVQEEKEAREKICTLEEMERFLCEKMRRNGVAQLLKRTSKFGRGCKQNVCNGESADQKKLKKIPEKCDLCSRPSECPTVCNKCGLKIQKQKRISVCDSTKEDETDSEEPELTNCPKTKNSGKNKIVDLTGPDNESTTGPHIPESIIDLTIDDTNFEKKVNDLCLKTNIPEAPEIIRNKLGNPSSILEKIRDEKSAQMIDIDNNDDGTLLGLDDLQNKYGNIFDRIPNYANKKIKTRPNPNLLTNDNDDDTVPNQHCNKNLEIPNSPQVHGLKKIRLSKLYTPDTIKIKNESENVGLVFSEKNEMAKKGLKSIVEERENDVSSSREVNVPSSSNCKDQMESTYDGKLPPNREVDFIGDSEDISDIKSNEAEEENGCSKK